MTIESSYTVLNTNYVNVNIRKLCDFCVFKVDYLLRQGFVCLSAGLWKDYCRDFHYTLWESIARSKEEPIQFRADLNHEYTKYILFYIAIGIYNLAVTIIKI